MPARRSSDSVISAGDEVIQRVFDAPRSLVFEVWTKAEHFARWFGPHGAEVVDCELDPRPGGIIRFGHRFPDGWTLFLKGTFGEVLPNERLSFSVGFVDEQGRPRHHPMFPDWPLDASLEVTVAFEDVAAGTRVRLWHRLMPPDIVSLPSVKRWGELALQGWQQTFDRLGDRLSLATTRRERPT
jgi:uncharacterized protein YndB with AHSA1/START domain